VILLSFVISSCSTTPPDVPICVEIDMQTGHCIYTISNTEYDVDSEHKINGKDWWELRTEMLLLPVDSWVEIKKFILKICKRTNRCDSNITNWERAVQSVDGLTIDKE
jgi:hypothetical protein